VGVVFSWIANPYFADIICAIERECYNSGFSVLLSDTNDDPEKELKVIQDLHQRRVDGIFFAPCPDPLAHSFEYLLDNDIPVVLVDRMPDQPFDKVGLDNEKALYMLVDHLVGHGYRDIAFVPGHRGYDTTAERTKGFFERMRYHGLENGIRITTPANTVIQAANIVEEMLRAGKPDAVITGNNLSTIGAMKAFSHIGLRVPADIALVGIDDFEWADSFEPRLTVIAQPCQEIGRNAAAIMKARIENRTRPIFTMRLEPRLVIRGSCGCSP
jgi:LacI family transcriptional regulator